MFVAVQPPDDVLDHLDDFLDARRDAADFRWTLREHLHVTLAFLAEVQDRARDDLEARLERAAKRRTAFAATLAGGGAFPNVARARVLWAGVDLSDPARTEIGAAGDGCAGGGLQGRGGGRRREVHATRHGRPAATPSRDDVVGAAPRHLPRAGVDGGVRPPGRLVPRRRAGQPAALRNCRVLPTRVTSVKIAVAAETRDGEARVAMVPGARRQAHGPRATTSRSSPAPGCTRSCPDEEYVEAGATIDADAIADADVVVSVQPLDVDRHPPAAPRRGHRLVPADDLRAGRGRGPARLRRHGLRDGAGAAHLAGPVDGRAVVAGAGRRLPLRDRGGRACCAASSRST